MNRNHVITIDEEVQLMNSQMKESPKLLNKFAGKESCCIFRVPQSLVDINKEAYRPRIVSIGPYHYGHKYLDMIQEHKWRFLDDLITRTGKPLVTFLNLMVSIEDQIRASYSESLDHFSPNDLAKMMVLDGVFLIELFRKVGRLVVTKNDDPIFRMAWVSPFLIRDLLRIENQIPFFVLQKLFDESKLPDDSRTLPSLILEFFNYIVHRPPRVLKEFENLEGKHLLDFFRKSFISSKKRSVVESKANGSLNNPSLKLIKPATKLVNSGIKFKGNDKADSFLDIEFQNGYLFIPQINIDDFHTSFILNCIAFEQCYSHCSNDITTYVVFMGCLMNTSADVSLLSENKIIENYFGTDKDIAKFFSNVGKDISFNIKSNYLLSLFKEVNDYSENGWHVGWAGFVHTYFRNPWAFISAFAAFMLLSLAALQTLYTVFPYYHKSK